MPTAESTLGINAIHVVTWLMMGAWHGAVLRGCLFLNREQKSFAQVCNAASAAMARNSLGACHNVCCAYAALKHLEHESVRAMQDRRW